MRFQDELKKNTTSIDQLNKYARMSSKEERQLRKIVERHPMSVSRYYMSLIDWNNPEDPIRRMAVPHLNEMNISGSYDTGGERENTKMPGLQHMYSQTALILSTNRCATYCRYCFRKRLVGLSQEEVLDRFMDAIKYIKRHKEINNVLISGGDPFVLQTRVIGKFLKKLSTIEHLDFIRFGTRTPVTFPDRICRDEKLQALLKRYSVPERRIHVVTQFNHPREITPQSTDAVKLLQDSGVIINNQTVLLKGVDDNPDVLAALQNGLVGIGVSPYYVFQCRPVKRVRHNFQIPLYRGYEIVEEARKLLNGHSNRFRYVMSHRRGKIEVVGVIDEEMYFKFHQARKPKNLGKLFKRKLSKTAGWLDDLEPIHSPRTRQARCSPAL